MLSVFLSQAIPLYDTQMRQPLNKLDLAHRLRNFLLQEAFKPDPLQKDHLPGVPVGRGAQCQTVRARIQLPSC